MKDVAAEPRRFGYRRVHIMLERQGIHMNQKKLRRLYREEGLQVRKRGGRKCAFWDECWDETLFSSLADARSEIAKRKEDYSQNRSHSSLGSLTPTSSRPK